MGCFLWIHVVLRVACERFDWRATFLIIYWAGRGLTEPHITPTCGRDPHRSISIRTSFYCPACWNVSRRPDPIDPLCTSLCLYVSVRSFEGCFFPLRMSFSVQKHNLGLSDLFSFLHIWPNPDKHIHIWSFLSLPLLHVLSPFHYCYYANQSPTHTPQWEQLVKGQPV